MRMRPRQNFQEFCTVANSSEQSKKSTGSPYQSTWSQGYRASAGVCLWMRSPFYLEYYRRWPGKQCKS